MAAADAIGATAIAPKPAATIPIPVATTFREAASEAVAKPAAAPGRSRVPLIAGAAVAIAAVAIVAVVLPRLRAGGGASEIAAPSARAVVVAPAAPAPPAVAPPGPPPATGPGGIPRALPPPAPGAPPPRAPSPAYAARPAARPTVAVAAPLRGARPAAAAVVSAGSPAPPTGAPPTGAAAGGLDGAWEGPWSDPTRQQKGRLFLQLGGDDHAASGWMYNTAAKQSFRMVGRISPAGELDLTCECPPESAFSARGIVRAVGAAELKGQLALSAAAGVFGQSHVTLRRTTASR